MKTAFALCLLLLVLSGGDHVEGRYHRRRNYKLLVFGDSFADTGNSLGSRAWIYPYGVSDETHGNRATGRFSDGLVQSDYVAKMLGRDESPPVYRHWNEERNKDDFGGVNFAVGGSAVLQGSAGVPSLSDQIEQLRRLVNAGDIDQEDLEDSVALISISVGHDYGQVTQYTDYDARVALSGRVTDGIVDAVRRLQRLGVSKVLVNSLAPLGCMPWQNRESNHAHCASHGNVLAQLHNGALRQKLDRSGAVLLLDLYTTITNIVEPNPGSSGSSNIRRKYTSCCDASSSGPGGYCGQVDAAGRPLYGLCPNPANFFYWDDMHPTQAAWKAVMDTLEGSITDFLANDW